MNKRIIVTIMALLALLCMMNCTRRTPRGDIAQTETKIDKAIIFYDLSSPWGVLKFCTMEVHTFLDDTNKSERDQIVLTDTDSLKPISDALHNAHFFPCKHSIDTEIAVLFFSGNRIDTLASDGYPQDPVELNHRSYFNDSTLVYYLIDVIRANSPVWDKDAKDFYYDGQYQHLPSSVFKKRRNESHIIKE